MASGWIGKTARRAIYARDNYTCCYCGKKCVSTFGVTSEENVKLLREHAQDIATLDHIVSQYEIAKTCESQAEFRRAIKDAKNLVTVCNGCNSRKKHYELYVFCSRMNFNYSDILERISARIK